MRNEGLEGFEFTIEQRTDAKMAMAVRLRIAAQALYLITVEDASGEEYEVGQLVTYLNDAVLIAPSMLLAPDVSWAPVDASPFDVSLVDHGRTVTARVVVDEKRAPSTPEF